MFSPFTCEHPRKIHNPYLDKWMYVPCGKCDLCRVRHSLSWVSRLEQERACHPYCIFGTLTYSEDNLPTFDLIPDVGFVESRTGELLEFKEYEDYIDTKSLRFIDKRGCLPYAKVEDAQMFIKRLRAAVTLGKRKGFPDSTDRQEDRYIRYFLVSELGETTFRPHFHFILFTSSKWFSEHAAGLVSSCWRVDGRDPDSKELGIIDAQNVCTSSSSYVASYLNCYTNSPLIYRHKRFRPFAIFSKSPALGSLPQSGKEIKRLFDSGSVTFDLYRRETNKIDKIPLPKSIYSRLYPKVTGFDRFSSDGLSELYCFSPDLTQVSYKDFRDFVRQRCQGFNDGLARYFKYICFHLTESESSLHQIFCILRRFQLQCRIFNISPFQYYNKILKFYQDLDYSRLKDYYLYYEDYSKYHGSTEMLLADGVFFDYLKEFGNSISDFYRESVVSYLNGFGYDENACSVSDFLLSVDMENNLDFVSSVSRSRKIVNDSRKKKAKNEYLEFRQKDSNFIDYLKVYHGLSEYNEGIG